MRESPTSACPVPDALCAEFSGFLTMNVGLKFPRERWGELAERMGNVAREFGHADAQSCIRWLMSSPLTRSQVEVLASHLTNGETYFFRGRESLHELDEHVLPELIRLRRTERRLRIWSAGCSSGEEPYSIAILLDDRHAELQGWDVTIHATDINPGFLRKAAQGCYGEWSFRGVPAEIKSRYFRKLPDGRFELLSQIRKRVGFSYLNLAQDEFPSLCTNTTAIDVIVCRNVLMYFAPDVMVRVLARFNHALRAGGWLILGAAESAHLRLPGWRMLRLESCSVFQKAEVAHAETADGTTARTRRADIRVAPRRARNEPAARPANPATRLAVAASDAKPLDARGLYAQGRYAEAAALLETADLALDGGLVPLIARCHANAGNLTAALAWSRKALISNALDPAAYYVHAVIETEAGHLEAAAQSLRRALYLDHDFVLAHIALANLSLRRGKRTLSRRHLDIALALLRRYAPQDLIAEADGMSAGGLTRIVESMQELDHAAA